MWVSRSGTQAHSREQLRREGGRAASQRRADALSAVRTQQGRAWSRTVCHDPRQAECLHLLLQPAQGSSGQQWAAVGRCADQGVAQWEAS